MRQLIIIAIVVGAYLFIKKLIRDSLAQKSGRPSTGNSARNPKRNTGGRADTGEEMVQDPNCGAYVPASRALTYNHAGEKLHFCSEDCANEYARKLKSGEIK